MGFIAGLIIGVLTGSLSIAFLLGASIGRREQEVYMEGYLAGQIERMKDNEVKKDKHCVGCIHIFDCKGKPHRNPCLNKERVKK